MKLWTQRMMVCGVGIALSALTVGALCQTPASQTPAAPNKQPELPAALPLAGRITPLNLPGVHNVFRVSPKLISGSAPEGDAAFKALAALGVKTIITVDGMKPDVAGAKKYGMRYVQIPFGYDGLPRQTSLTLARAVRELPGLIYLHCHHGKHRSATAAACVLVANNGWSNSDALAFLTRAGTGTNYIGLWQSVRTYQVPTAAEIARAPHTYPAIAPAVPLVTTMLRLDELTERLGTVQHTNWSAPATHPNLDPPHEALMLREIFTELQRTEALKTRPANFRAWLASGEAAGAELEAALRAKDGAHADVAYKKVMDTCASCHAVYRNVPQH